jgi:uncharacterized membrane protein YdfJ with MMPL/SSD domain
MKPHNVRRWIAAAIALFAAALVIGGVVVPQQLSRASTRDQTVLADDDTNDDWVQQQAQQQEEQDQLQQQLDLQMMLQAQQEAEQQNELAQQEAQQAEQQGLMVEQEVQAGQ